MGQYTSYYLYQKFEHREGNADYWIPVYPNTFSIDADGTKPKVVKIENDTECGYVPPYEPVYRWTVLTPTSNPNSYYCDNCPIYQWVEITPSSADPNTYVCDDCPPIYAWNKAPITDYICDNTTHIKYYKEYYQVSYNDGITWQNVVPTQTRQSTDVIEYDSVDCGYVPVIDYSKRYITFEAISAGTFSFSGTSSSTIDNSSIQYSLNSGSTWNTLNRGSNVSVSAGQKIMWKGNLNPTSQGIGRFSGTKKFNVEGNVMSLLYGDNFSGETSLSGKEYAFEYLFLPCSGLTSAENFILPATTLEYNCYTFMFGNCTSLTTAPELPATTLANYCYNQMFANCTSLATAPVLSASTLGYGSYYQMFYNCTSLTTAPTLSAITAPYRCYQGMFYGCTSLTTAPELPATTLEDQCYWQMFSGCTSLTTAPSTLPATTLAYECYDSMFQGCTSLTTAPQLPATTLAIGCYNYMFDGCINLRTAPVLSATTLANFCYDTMFRGCINLTTAPELPATTLATYCYREMFKNCTSLNYVKCLATDISASNCTSYWLDNVASAGTFVKASSMSSWPTSADGIPSGWTVENDSPTPTPTDYSTQYLTFVPTESATTFTFNSVSGDSINYSLDSGSTWNTLASGVSTPSVAVGQKIMWKASSLTISSNYGIGTFTSTDDFDIEGNIMSLLYGEYFSGQTMLGSSGVFTDLFSSTNVISAENLVLPATELATYCYKEMFKNCSGLTTAPVLSATTLKTGCYYQMFRGCTSLTSAPVLSASTLVSSCYYGMFYECSSLTYIECLATDISAAQCTWGWVYGVSSTGMFFKDSSMSGWTVGSVHGIPSYWIVVDV